MSVSIRHAKTTDYKAVADLYRTRLLNLAKNYPDQYRQEGALISLRQEDFLTTLEDENWEFIVAEEDGALVGAIQLSLEDEEENEYRHAHRYAWIEELVLLDEQNEKTAKALLEAAEQWASEHSVHDIDFIVYDFSSSLIKLCENLGYRTVSTRLRKSTAK